MRPEEPTENLPRSPSLGIAKSGGTQLVPTTALHAIAIRGYIRFAPGDARKAGLVFSRADAGAP